MNTQSTQESRFTPSRVWVDSRVKGVGQSWYYGGKDQMHLSELQPLLDEHNACVCYKDEFYDNIDDIPFVEEYLTYYTYGMPTGSIKDDPTVTVVPKGTKWDDSPLYQYLGKKRFVFPKNA